MEETIGLGFHSHRDAITGVTSSTAAVSAASSIDQQHATTKFVSSSADSKRMSMLFPPPPPHPSTAVQQPIIQLIDNRHPSLQIRQQQQQLPLSTSSTQQPNDMHQNINFTNHPPTSSSFQPPPGLPPPLSIPAAITVPPLQFPPPPIPIQQQSHIDQQQSNDSIAKARAIAQRFHTQSNTQPPSYISSINNQHSNSVNINNNNNDNTNVNKNINSYAQKRQQHFQNEQLKLQTYTLKNLDYILKHDETQLRSHVECMNEMTEWGEQQGLQLQLLKQQQLEREQKREQQKQQRQQQQREVQQKSGGGIGSKDQRYLERIKRRRQLDTTATGANPQLQQQRTSIYLTNLPTDGSINERTLRSLFCVYGHLDRVTMYRNRSTGELKGDGLIVFGVDDATINLGGNESGNNVQETTTNGRDLIETVCMQMNGAELPCGTVIGVEPADMDWGRRGKDEKFKQMDHCVQQLQQQGTASSGEGDVVMQSKEASMKGEDDDEEEEDLDDFFASLE